MKTNVLNIDCYIILNDVNIWEEKWRKICIYNQFNKQILLLIYKEFSNDIHNYAEWNWRWIDTWNIIICK